MTRHYARADACARNPRFDAKLPTCPGDHKVPFFRSLLLCVLFVSARAYAQTPPAPLATAPAAAAADAAYTIELQQMRVRFETDGTGRRELTLRVRVADERAVRQWGQVPVLYQPETEDLELKEVEIHKPDGTIVKSAAGAVQDLAVRPSEQSSLFLDIRQKQITVSALRPGDVLSLGAVWIIKHPIAPGYFWFEHSFNKNEIVRDERLDIDVPAARAVVMRIEAGAPAEESGGRGVPEGDRRIYRWKTSNLKTASRSDARQADRDGAPPADVRLSSFRDWAEFARWFRGLVSIAPDAEVRAKAAELTSGARDEVARIDAIYSYVASQIRYVSLSFGLGRFAPHPPAEVLKNQYGDCKDKAVLLGSLLAAVGIESVPVLLNNSRSISDMLASPLEFNHMIAVVPRSGEAATWTWMDPTLEVAPLGMLAPPTRDRRALFLGGTGRPSAVLRTPLDLPFPSIDRIDVIGKVNDIGVLTARVTVALRGDAELLTRTLLRALPRDALKDIVTELAASQGMTGNIADISTSKPTVTSGPFEIRFELRTKGYLNWAAATSEMPMIPTAVLPFAKEEDREGMDRIDLGSPKTVRLHAAIEVPPAYTLRAPVAVHSSSAGVTYASTYTVEGHRLLVNRELVTTAREIPAAQFGAFSALVTAAQADLSQRVAVTGNVKGIPTIPADATAAELYNAAFDAYEAQRYDAAAALWKRNTEIDPKMGAAWDSLGLTYDKLERYNEAVAAIQKQIDLDPYNKRAYGDIGHALRGAGKRIEAAKAYAKHVDLNPLDGDALKQLGELYNDLGRYTDAAAAFEKAAMLVKGDAWIFANLGVAYLRLKQAEKAQTAFSRALELSSSIAIQSNIAWHLAESGVDLDRAAGLASGAEKEIVEKTRQLDLSSLNHLHLDLMERLAWTWDTLGWIQFQKGNILAAEAYVRAAWQLGGKSIVAFHLGRICEKRGKLADALSYYLTAQATSSNPTPEMMAHVRRLSGGGDLSKMLDSAKRLAPGERTIRITGRAPAGKAQFLAIVGSDRLAREVRFVSGSEALRTLEAPLREAGYPVDFPAEFAGRLALGIRMVCTEEQRCFATVAYPEKVRLDEESALPIPVRPEHLVLAADLPREADGEAARRGAVLHLAERLVHALGGLLEIAAPGLAPRDVVQCEGLAIGETEPLATH